MGRTCNRQRESENVLGEQNIINYSNTETVKEISCTGDFVDINNDYSVDMYEQLPHKTVSVNAKILRNIYGREYADGTLTLDGREYKIQGFNRDNSFGKNRIFISVITSDGKMPHRALLYAIRKARITLPSIQGFRTTPVI